MKAVFALFFALVLSDASYAATISNRTPFDPDLLKPINSYSVHADQSYVGLNLSLPPADRLRTELESRLGHKLKTRGESHITVITPPEFKALTQSLPIPTLSRLLEDSPKPGVLRAICIGAGSLQIDGAIEKTYFVVLSAPGLIKLRQKIAMEFVKAGGAAAEFKPADFNPHVTLGFTKRDLHSTDGVVKDKNSCISKM